MEQTGCRDAVATIHCIKFRIPLRSIDADCTGRYTRHYPSCVRGTFQTASGPVDKVR